MGLYKAREDAFDLMLYHALEVAANGISLGLHLTLKIWACPCFCRWYRLTTNSLAQRETSVIELELAFLNSHHERSNYMFHPRCGGIIAVGIFASLIGPIRAANISLQGAFSSDDQVQFFNVLLSAPAAVDIRSYGYAGGTLSSAVVVPSGGFDTVLTLFDSFGSALFENDDGPGVATDPSTGEAWDARIMQSLAAGSYILSVAQYDNYLSGNNLSDGFDRLGDGNFTADSAFSDAAPCPSGRFRDFSGTAGRCRSGSWAIDFLNVSEVTPAGLLPVPEPLPAGLLVSAFGLLLTWSRLRR